MHENLSRNLKHTLRTLHRRSKTKHVVQALRDVSFEVRRGSVYGVIGHNGAGKSTLFRVLAGVLPPDAGRVELWGRVTPLLSLGVGLQPRAHRSGEHPARGVWRPACTARRSPPTPRTSSNFAELGDAIDRPMRTYSSGMFGRLGFAIAAHLDPEIILIDEALSAGDAAFKDRCADKLLELVEGDCTVMIVSHGVTMVQQMGERCLWLDHGRVVTEGPADEVVESYLEQQGMAESEDVAVRIDI